jgi:hypothetical protein
VTRVGHCVDGSRLEIDDDGVDHFVVQRLAPRVPERREIIEQTRDEKEKVEESTDQYATGGSPKSDALSRQRVAHRNTKSHFSDGLPSPRAIHQTEVQGIRYRGHYEDDY